MALIDGCHHPTMSVDGAQEDFDFFTKTLGMKSVKKTELFDGTTPVYHLYYGNAAGDASTIVTTFPFRKPGIFGKCRTDQTKVIQLAVPPKSLDFWEERLNKAGRNKKQIEGFGIKRVAFEHPCGIPVEAADEPEGKTGQTLVFPPWFEDRKAEMVAGLEEFEW